MAASYVISHDISVFLSDCSGVSCGIFDIDDCNGCFFEEGRICKRRRREDVIGAIFALLRFPM